MLFASVPGVDVLSILDRCVRIERGAGEIYETLAGRFSGDPAFCGFWKSLAADEREHAHKLSVWRSLLEQLPVSRRPGPQGFERDLPVLENLVRDSRKAAAEVATADEAFAIALALETSELDVIYTTLLQSSPIHRFPDVEDTRRRELGHHHESLVREIRARSKSEKNLYEAELIAAAES